MWECLDGGKLCRQMLKMGGKKGVHFTLSNNVKQKHKDILEENIPTAAKTQEKKLKILISEYDLLSDVLIQIYITNFNKEILKSRSGAEAINACQHNPDIDLILMNNELTEMYGIETIRQIRELNKGVIIISLVALGEYRDREKAIEAGCNDYMTKPIHKAELHTLIEKYFGEKVDVSI